jgi:hypothetical protein
MVLVLGGRREEDDGPNVPHRRDLASSARRGRSAAMDFGVQDGTSDCANAETLFWVGQHNVDYAALRGYAPFEKLVRLRDEEGVRSLLTRIALLARR